MKKSQFEKLVNEEGFDEAMAEFCAYSDYITTYDTLKDFIKEKIDEDNIMFALHLLKAIWEDDTIGETNYYRYDYSMGTLETPTPIHRIEDIEDLFKEEEDA